MVLHPLFKDEYFKLAKWKPKWIQESIRLTREMWEAHYQPSPHPPNSQPPTVAPKDTSELTNHVHFAQKPYIARGSSAPTDPLTTWLAGGFILDEKGGLVNPLKWWMRQHPWGAAEDGT
ncbi:hypothetical protein PTTG_01766 [Puccinia triticina 1-1 BBBD Race 1]|uniref:Uncharacterized protein n=1 Tax=Puccinia triticina (isolate 1-1 / race 1 (BBBD)) TaxID=630390 RepID=A0A180H0R7_PUCT1|nr:hypothetical protein PTTG_01766 [Puccinia triticina 1-1 BBBD Race 1]